MGEITTDEADLKTATEIYDKKASDCAAFGKELTEIIDTLNGASGFLERHLRDMLPC